MVANQATPALESFSDGVILVGLITLDIIWSAL